MAILKCQGLNSKARPEARGVRLRPGKNSTRGSVESWRVTTWQRYNTLSKSMKSGRGGTQTLEPGPEQRNLLFIKENKPDRYNLKRSPRMR